MPRYLDEQIDLLGRSITLRFVTHRRARHYILRLRDDGAVQVTLPAYGTKKEAMAFASRNRCWLEQQTRVARSWDQARRAWHHGMVFLYRGNEVPLQVEEDLFGTTIRFADQAFHVDKRPQGIRECVHRHLRGVAKLELPARVRDLADAHELSPRRVSVRSQRTLWGSCSNSGSISLNWRLVQAPAWVKDYVITHELMHLKEFNHSRPFWELVAAAYPAYRRAEGWLRSHHQLLAD